MCGILGLVGDEVQVRARHFEDALTSLAHRGPDDDDTWRDDGCLLGHRRLSIVDLSAAGRQPMVDPESGAVLVFNGEVYNYLELRAELETHGMRFRTATDSEVLLKALVLWGTKALDKLNGMFAFAVWFPKTRRLLIARDRFGVKPLYYWRRGHSFAFASEPKALLRLRLVEPAADEVSLARFVALADYQGSERTFYRDIAMLPPGHVAEFVPHEAHLRLERWWDYPDDAAAATSPERAIDEFQELFDDAVRLRLRSDVPVGLSLSGGLDSTMVLAGFVKSAGVPPLCLTSVFGRSGDGEASWAEVATRPYGFQPTRSVADPAQWLDTLERIAWHMDGPCDTPAVFPVYCLMRDARGAGVPVMLEGQGADELFAGYAPFAALHVAARMRGRRLGQHDDLPLTSLLRRYHGTFGNQLMSQLARSALPQPFDWMRRRRGGRQVLADALRTHVPPVHEPSCSPPKRISQDPIAMRLWRNHSFDSLPRYLHYSDALGMAHSIESRMPFMDFRLVEWAFRQSSSLKLLHAQSKWPVRAYLRRHGQDAIAERVDKRGYPTPLSSWLTGEPGKLVLERLTSSQANISTFIDKSALSALFERGSATRSLEDSLLFRVLTLELWLEQAKGHRVRHHAGRPALLESAAADA